MYIWVTKESQTKSFSRNSELTASSCILQLSFDTAHQIFGGFETGNIPQDVD